MFGVSITRAAAGSGFALVIALSAPFCPSFSGFDRKKVISSLRFVVSNIISFSPPTSISFWPRAIPAASIPLFSLAFTVAANGEKTEAPKAVRVFSSCFRRSGAGVPMTSLIATSTFLSPAFFAVVNMPYLQQLVWMPAIQSGKTGYDPAQGP
ncbi:hypothetical protein NB646_05890 [Oxalobacter aliiformigenes]|uniref:Uncharacterized protein n=1 Tax=Oxalobacter aliiformigenes TaxID=2946593 RepID=A0A9E9NSM7_9BURK|nr:hypothetical protein [Oxalobacter aliiformigenes]WAV90404.1 hypothetical protein NB646_05890 [Oxalobacter aliiformigenes]